MWAWAHKFQPKSVTARLPESVTFSLPKSVYSIFPVTQGKGHYISLDQHKPPGKREKDLAHYLEKAGEIGPHVKSLVETIYDQAPNHWRDKARGLISLKRRFPNDNS